MELILVNAIKFHHYNFMEYYLLSKILHTFTCILYTTLVLGGFQVYEGKDGCLGHCWPYLIQFLVINKNSINIFE